MMNLTDRFAHLYRGKQGHMGKFTPDGKLSGKGKVLGRNEIVPQGPTQEDWMQHLWQGIYSIGIIPINEENQCAFAAIDIDEYESLDKVRILQDIEKQKLPIVACESKSGGIHLYIFFKVPVAATEAKRICNSFAARLGVATLIIDGKVKDTETFPKQIFLTASSTGSYINLPYANGSRSAVILVGDAIKPISLEEFVTLAESKMITDTAPVSDAPKVSAEMGVTSRLYEAPPCITLILKANGGTIPEGARNTVMFNIGVMLKLRYPEDWKEHLPDYNQAYCVPELSYRELDSVIKSLETKDEYFYMCSSQPMCNYCDKASCRMKKYGIGTDTENMDIGDMTIVRGEPKIVLLNINGYEVDFVTEEIIGGSSNAFKRKVFERTDMVLPHKLNMEAVSALIKDRMTSAKYVIVPLEATLKGQMMLHLQDYIRHDIVEYESSDDMWASLINGKVVQRDDSYFFKINNFISYLNMNRFTGYTNTKIYSVLKDNFNGSSQSYSSRGQGISVRYWRVDADKVDRLGREDES